MHSNFGLELSCIPSSRDVASTSPGTHQSSWPLFNSCSSQKLNLKLCLLLFLDILRPQDIMKCDHTYNSRRNPINSFNIHADPSSVCNHGRAGNSNTTLLGPLIKEHITTHATRTFFLSDVIFLNKKIITVGCKLKKNFFTSKTVFVIKVANSLPEIFFKKKKSSQT